MDQVKVDIGKLEHLLHTIEPALGGGNQQPHIIGADFLLKRQLERFYKLCQNHSIQQLPALRDMAAARRNTLGLKEAGPHRMRRLGRFEWL